MHEIAVTAKVYPNVRLGDGVRIGPWSIIGLPPEGANPGEFETVIGPGSTIRSHTVVYAGSKIGEKFQTGHYTLIGPGMHIGNRCSIGTSSLAVGFARLHDGARVHGHGYLGAFASLNERAWMGPYNIVESNIEKISVVGSGAILTMGVHLYPGVRIGERALVGMRSQVREDVLPYRVVVGNPPRGIRTIDQLISPDPAAGPPYEADPPDIQVGVLERHETRCDCSISDTDWRVALWNNVQAALRRRHEVQTERANLAESLAPAMEFST